MKKIKRTLKVAESRCEPLLGRATAVNFLCEGDCGLTRLVDADGEERRGVFTADDYFDINGGVGWMCYDCHRKREMRHKRERDHAA